MAKEDKSASKSYGGRSKKFYFLVYVVVAIIVYAIIYWVWIRKPGGTSGGGSLY